MPAYLVRSKNMCMFFGLFVANNDADLYRMIGEIFDLRYYEYTFIKGVDFPQQNDLSVEAYRVLLNKKYPRLPDFTPSESLMNLFSNQQEKDWCVFKEGFLDDYLYLQEV